jgi:tRNA dimethylallyltransferase
MHPLPLTAAPQETPVIVLVGATATGKSALALELAELLGDRGVSLEIVNADALQVYRGFDVGTAKPTPEERARVPHHLIDVLDPSQRYSAGEFARRAHRAIGEIRERGGLPVVVGGSGLYVKALLEGLSPVPPGDPEIRAELLRRVRVEGLPALYRELRERDPETAARLPPGDTQRILRALEVERVSGRPLSRFIRRQPFGTQRLDGLRIGLTVERPFLYDQIAARVVRMMDLGWLEEVLGLLEQGLAPDLPAFQAIGYRQIVRHLEGEWTLDEAMADIQRETRRFAKRQETWFRKDSEITWFDAQEDRLPPRILEHIEQNGLGRAYA